MKPFFITATLAILSAATSAFGQASIIAPVTTAALTEIFTRGSSSQAVRVGAPIAAGLAGLAGGIAYDNYKDSKEAREKFHAYQLGLWHDAWIHNNMDWYYSTLDRKTGLPPAFDGYWAMFVGLPTVEKDVIAKKKNLPPQSVPGNRDAYLDYLLAASTQQEAAAASPDNAGVIDVPTVRATTPQRVRNGVTYEAQTREFPQLP